MKVVVALFVFFLTSSWVSADTMYPVITYTCDIKADVIKIKNEVKWNEEGKAVKYHDDENLGVYNPWDWVTIDTKSAEKQILESKVIEKNCQLSSGIYKVILQPHIFVVNPDAKCGDQLSVLVTILRGGNSLLDKQAMQEFCLGNAPVLRGVKVMGGTGDLKLYEVPRHKFY